MLKSTVEAMLAVRKAADVCDRPGEAHILRMVARELDTFDVPDDNSAIEELEALVSVLTVVYDRSNSNALDEALDNAICAVRVLIRDARDNRPVTVIVECTVAARDAAIVMDRASVVNFMGCVVEGTIPAEIKSHYREG